MNSLTSVRRHGQGSARSALPFVLLLLLAARTASAATAPSADPPELPHLDAGSRLLLVRPSTFDTISEAVGFPNTGGTLLLWGAGGTVTPGLLRAQVAAWTGGLSAVQGSKTTSWGMDLGALSLEQRYPVGQFTLTAGSSFEMGQLTGVLDDGGSLTRVLAQVYGFGINAGARWPAQTRMGFSARVGYLWLGGAGIWHGALAQNPVLGTSQFDLSGPDARLQAELSF